MSTDTARPPMYFLRMLHGSTPASKKVAIEAMETSEEHVLFVPADRSADSPSYRAITLDQLEPGQTVRYTDGQGKYFGRVTRSLDGKGLLFDSKEAK